MSKILIVDDESDMRVVLSAMLKKEGFDVAAAANGQDALQILKSNKIAVIVTDLKMPDIDGMELLDRVSAQHPEIPVIMITAHGTIATAVEAMKKGALDYITKPFDQDEFKSVIFKAVRTSSLKENELFLPPEDLERAGIIGTSRSTQDVFDAIKRVAPSKTTVLITGETGTGKELVADAIHCNSPRKANPLIKINCAAIAGTLMDRELFGYKRGAFTGAAVTKPGKFELADAGTLFLDEVSEIPGDVQIKLLRVLQEQQFERVGGMRTIKVDVRIIAAASQNLWQQVQAGKFREDLYNRLNVFSIDVPPLRERKDDILLLADYFLDKFNKKLELSVTIDEETKEKLLRYNWPGNIRELENIVKKMMLMAKDNVVTFREMPYELKLPLEEGEKPLKEFMRNRKDDVEREMIARCLEEQGGNVTRAARELGLSRKGLQLKMIKYKLRRE
jgi:two-component system, NtrC family, response regulator AtoC